MVAHLVSAPSLLDLGKLELKDSATSNVSGSLSLNVTLPSYVAGDLLVIIGGASASSSGGSGSHNTPSGWNVASNTSNVSSAIGSVAVFWKIADGSEGSSVATSGSNGSQRAAIALSFSAKAKTVDAANSGTATQDPPNLSLSGSADTIWIAVSGNRIAFSSAGSIGLPSGYTNRIQSSTPASAASITLVVGFLQNTASSENPGAFSGTSGPQSATIGVR